MNYGKSENVYCKNCEVDLIPVESDDALIVKHRCPKCKKQWEFHLNEDRILGKVVVVELNTNMKE